VKRLSSIHSFNDMDTAQYKEEKQFACIVESIPYTVGFRFVIRKPKKHEGKAFEFFTHKLHLDNLACSNL